MNKWNSLKIGELVESKEADLQTGPFGTQLKASDYVSEGTPVINVRNIGFGEVREAKLEFLNEQMVQKLHVHQLVEEDIVFGRKGAVDRHAFIQSENSGWIQGSDCLRLRLNSERVSARFLSYFFNTSAHKYWMEAQCSFGATMSSLNQDIVKRITFPAPTIEIQKKITAVLSAYDDLIENNNKRIALLEKTAEEIYREWFVRLRFPGWETAVFHKGIPDGWNTKTIGNICSKVTDGAHSSPEFQENGMYMASVKDMHSNGFSLDSIKTISEQDFRKLERSDCRPLKNDVLIAKDGSYLKHVFVWNDDVEIVILSSIAILRPDIEEVLPNFLALTLKQDSTKSMMSGFVSGSALPRIILKDFKKMKLLLPSMQLMNQFESIIDPIYQNIHIALKQNQLLKQTRDLLLSRLISGKLSVDDLDIQFPPSMILD